MRTITKVAKRGERDEEAYFEVHWKIFSLI
jgi:hypothetical protein